MSKIAGGGKYSYPYDSTSGIPEVFTYILAFFGIVLILFLIIVFIRARKIKK